MIVKYQESQFEFSRDLLLKAWNTKNRAKEGILIRRTAPTAEEAMVVDLSDCIGKVISYYFLSGHIQCSVEWFTELHRHHVAHMYGMGKLGGLSVKRVESYELIGLYLDKKFKIDFFTDEDFAI